MSDASGSNPENDPRDRFGRPMPDSEAEAERRREFEAWLRSLQQAAGADGNPGQEPAGAEAFDGEAGGPSGDADPGATQPIPAEPEAYSRAEVFPADADPATPRPIPAEGEDVSGVEFSPADADPGATRPIPPETGVVPGAEGWAAGADPGATRPIQAKPGDFSGAEVFPADPDPGATRPIQTGAFPAGADPNATRPVQSGWDATEAGATRPIHPQGGDPDLTAPRPTPGPLRRPPSTQGQGLTRPGAAAQGAGPTGEPGVTQPVPPLTRPRSGRRSGSLPRPVSETDPDATRVTPSAYAGTGYPRRPVPQRGRGGTPPGAPPPLAQPVPGAAPQARKNTRRSMGCLLKSILIGAFGVVFLALCGLSFMFLQYYSIARTLPDINDLRDRASQFETTRLLDRNGNLLYEILDPNAGRRTYVPLEEISPYLVAATVATEDKGFYSHPGVDVWAILRAFYQNYQSGETVSGASTITQQLARNLLFSPEERVEQSYQRKIREAILATEITRRYSKDEILELYLNENYYGNLAYGVEAAAETYFHTSADQLTLGQAAFLAGLPQAPSVYDIYSNPEATLARTEDVLVLMFETSQEQGCIFVSNYPQRICLDAVSITNAAQEIKNYDFQPQDDELRYPHWVVYVRSLLEAQYDPQTIYRSGFTVYTTLDPGLQDRAEQIVKEQVANLADRNASDGALVALRPGTGEILAMVGSADFHNEAISGQVNMAVSPRQPGSSIKPLTYAAAFEKGWTPSTLIWDVQSEFPPSGRPDDTREPYVPVNYDGRFHGPVTVRSALANSYNIPAVKTLDFVGIYDDPETEQEDGFLAFARRLGISTLTRPDYGLSLTLGGGDVTLLELTNAYATFANQGRLVAPVAITRILDHTGAVVYEYTPPAGEQVIRSEHAYLITSILSDNRARTPAFGENSVLNLPFPAAVKTGTTNDFRDNWTLGYTPQLAVGVWVGNADYTPMQNTSGLAGAAPIWSQFMQEAVEQITGGTPANFPRPGGIVEYTICAVSGTQPSQWCPEQRSEIFAADQPPLPKEEDLWREVVVDTWTELQASEACSEFTEKRFVLNVTDPWARRWIRQDGNGQAWAEEMGFEERVSFVPNRECSASDPQPRLSFDFPREGQTIEEGRLEVRGEANATDLFDFWRLEYGIGDDPVEWDTLAEGEDPVNDGDVIYEWDLQELVDEEGLSGPITLKLYIQSEEGTFAETMVHLRIAVPTATPTPTMTPTPTQTPTMTPTATPTTPPTTAAPPTAVPPTAVPPTAEPPTAGPPTAEPPTAEPPTAQPIRTDEPVPGTIQGPEASSTSSSLVSQQTATPTLTAATAWITPPAPPAGTPETD